MRSIKHPTLTLRRLSIAVSCAALAACGAGSDPAQDSSGITRTDALVSSSGTLAGNVLTGPVTGTVPTSGTTTTTSGTSTSGTSTSGTTTSGTSTSGTSTSGTSTSGTTTSGTTTSGTTTSGTTTSGTTTTTPVSGTAITDVRFQNTSATVTQNNVPETFGQVFAPGALKPTDALTGRLEDGTTVPLQVDVKATHADGSVRHAIISAIVPSIAPAKVRTMSLIKGGTAPTGTVSISSLTGSGFTASVHAKVAGVDYYASADELLKSGAGVTTWLNGPVATEWEVSAPLHSTSGAQHPHLSARFSIRWYPGLKKARVDVVVENDWAYEPAPQNFTYDASVLVGGQTVYSKTGMTHYHHARWRKLFWFNGTEPQVNVQLNTTYLISTRAVPNYDRSITIAETALAAYKTKWTGSITEPMSVGLVNPSMATTGGRPDIGLLPAFTVNYLLSMDKRAKDVMLGTADLAGSWSAHYRDRKTGQPMNVENYPYATVYGQRGDTYNKATGQYEAFPLCATSTACATPNSHDTAHTPNFAYLPYIVTGDHYYLEELQFWSMYSAFSSNPSYRNYAQGLWKTDQVRGQAWSMRTGAEAAYITPDNDPMKASFVRIINNNLDNYNATYTNGTTTSNALGVITGNAFAYNNGTGLAPWQDDFFTSAVGHASDLGFTKADALLAWKSKFPISRMTGAGTCWIDGAIYAMNVRPSTTSPLYTTIAQAYTASHTASFLSLQCGSAAMASALGLKVGEMTGFSDGTEGYPSNMQPALAYAARAGGTAGQDAWTKFMARSVKPDYSGEPQFDIVPR